MSYGVLSSSRVLRRSTRLFALLGLAGAALGCGVDASDSSAASLAAGATASGEHTLLGTSTPAIAQDTDRGAVTLGLRWYADQAGRVVALRFYKGGTSGGSTHKVALYSKSGASLARATSSAESPSGWQRVNLPAPLSISANTEYVVAVHWPWGRYPATLYGCRQQLDVPPLHAHADGAEGRGNGVYAYGSRLRFPTATWNASNYFVDVVFVPESPAPPPPPPGGSDTIAPSVPQLLTATPASSSQINLRWSASTDNTSVSGYTIFRDGARVGSSPTPSYSDAGLASDRSYSYRVSAYDAAGNVSAQSAAATATTLPGSGGTVLEVGPGKPYSTLAGAIAAAQSGSTINVAAGTYDNQFVSIAKNLTIVGVGGRAHFRATQPIGNGKGIFIVNGGVTIDNLEFSGATVADRNGAGIRYEGGILTVRNSLFHDNQNGILGASASTGEVHLSNSQFLRNGYGDGYTHGVYINEVRKLVVTNCTFRDTRVGHHLKSRALETQLLYSILDDGAGTASYNFDAPNGGVVRIQESALIQSAATSNPTMLAFGEEGSLKASNSLTVTGAIFVNNRSAGATGVWNAAASTNAVLSNNTFVRVPTIASGPATQTATKTTSVDVPIPAAWGAH